MACNCRSIMPPTRRARSYPKAGVSFALLRKCLRLEDDGFGRLDRARTELPLVRRKKPGPTERLASVECSNRNKSFSRNVCRFQSDFTVMNQIKMIRIIAFLENLLAGRERSMPAHSISRGKYCGGSLFQKGCRARISSRVFMTISESSSFELSPQDRCSTYRELAILFVSCQSPSGFGNSQAGRSPFCHSIPGKSLPGQAGIGRRIDCRVLGRSQRLRCDCGPVH